jgi:hypothetical protein
MKELYPDGYILVVTVNHLLFTGLVLLFFQEGWDCIMCLG